MDIKQVIGDYEAFVTDLLQRAQKVGVELADFPIDHICYRVDSLDSHAAIKAKLMPFVAAFAENVHHGRPITKLRLRSPLQVDDYEIPLIELPAPKSGAAYPNGLEHVELAVGTGFADFVEKYGELWSGGDDSGAFNQTVFIAFDNGKTIKFHERPLMEVMKLEGTAWQQPTE